MTSILTLLGPDSILYALGAAVVVAFIAFMKGRLSGAERERNKQAKRDKKAIEDRLEMDREATAAEREAGRLSDEEARREALKWSKR